MNMVVFGEIAKMSTDIIRQGLSTNHISGR